MMDSVTSLVVLMATIWVAGLGLVLLLSRIKSQVAATTGMTRLMLSEGLILACATLLVTAPPLLQWPMLALFTLRIAYEARHVWLSGPRNGISILAALAMPVLPFTAFLYAVTRHDSAAMILLALLLVESFDSFSLLGGKLFGHHLLLPTLSPRKTWEGLLVGVAGLVVTTGVVSIVAGVTMQQLTTVAATTLLLAPVGDLLASFNKRLAGVKDYPVVFSGQGGVLDIVDAWIMVSPVAACLAGMISQ